jgi:hypothetical protein
LGTLEAIAALTSTDCAPPLGSHPGVGKLVAIRYGAALADPQVAAMVARGKTASAYAATSNGDAPPADHGDAPPADPAEARPAAEDAAEAESASAPPAGTSAQ